MSKFLPICLFIGLSISLWAQPKREFRATWITHVNNIDFPSAANLTDAQQRAQFITIVDDLKRNGINAAIVHIRTNCDAAYPSTIEPWSAFWTGRQGAGPAYDPLAFMIDECHKRGIEFHAWFNPYRAAPTAGTFAAANHVRTLRPDWILAYNGTQILDPALPDVRAYVTRVIMDVVRRYDIDAVHFDDYFYPYPVTGVTLNDATSFANHNRGFTNINDWRRDNIDLLIKMVNDSVKAAKPYVKFGISPFGIWKNKSASQPDGSDTRGLEAFHSIYADSRKWVQEGWIDYIVPQVYWSMGYAIADFSIITRWWASNLGTRNRHLYIGHAAYRMNNGGTADPTNWAMPSQMPNQIRFTRNTPSVLGSIFYNTTTFRGNILGFNDSLKQNLYKIPALVPTMPWIDAFAPPAPQSLAAQRAATGVQLTWVAPTTGTNEMDKVNYYVVYRFAANETVDIAKSTAIRAILPANTSTYVDTLRFGATIRYNYVVTAVDRLHNESVPSPMATLLVSPTSDVSKTSLKLHTPMPNPFSNQVTIRYELQSSAAVNLAIYDILGQKIAQITEGGKMEGLHEENFDGSGLANGVYLVVLTVGNQRVTQRLVKN
jgi:uncharacterized lipoprotein YddW (UPF0748 family)